MKHGKTATAAALAALAALSALCALPAARPLAAQQTLAFQEDRGVVGVGLRLRQLGGVKRVLMIAAHPDDEDTSLLAALARGMGVETAYLSLTRGEGGQNLIGPRLYEGLGVIRTGELVAARALDGGAQFFTRAFDYGFSKTLDEAMRLWPAEDVVRDVVHVVRTFRPHVIVSVFSGTPRDGHGQHQYAGVASQMAFAAAGDPAQYPELAAAGIEPWQPVKLYRSARFLPQNATLRIPTGDFDPLLGRSHHQVAMDSRSQHRSQDMGSGQGLGPRSTAIELVEVAEDLASATTTPEDGIFAGVDTTLWGQVGPSERGGWPGDAEARIEAYRAAVARAAGELSLVDPRGAADGLAEAATILASLLDEASDDTRGSDGRRVLEQRLGQVREALLAAAGVVVETRVGRDLLTPGESVVVDVNVWNGGSHELQDIAPRLLLPPGWRAERTDESTVPPSRSPFRRVQIPPTPTDGRVAPGAIGRWSWRVEVPADARATSPYFLDEPREGALYPWPDDASLWGLPFDPVPIRAVAEMAVAIAGPESGRMPGPTAPRVSSTGGADARAADAPATRAPVAVAARRDGVFVGVDQALGEYRRRVHVVPALNIALDPPWMVWPATAAEPRQINVALSNTSASLRTGTVSLEAPSGWTVQPAAREFELGPDGATGAFTFAIAPSPGAGAPDDAAGRPAPRAHAFAVVAREGGAEHRTAVDIVDHPHIERVALAREAALRVSVVDVAANTSLRVGYLMGSGDDGATVLRELGMEVVELDAPRVRAGDFSGLDVVVLGVRAYETRPDLVAANDALLDFARSGGTVVAQYNRYELPAGGYAPYPVAMSRPHDRVTDETAAVTLLDPGSPVFTRPNQIGPDDFADWVQERGLYFLGEWDDRYTPLVEMADPGEEGKRGSLVVAEVGEGLYVYTGLAFFRQFPAGVPGAYRLFANLVSLRAGDWRARIFE